MSASKEEINPHESPRHLFAFELRRYRQAAGLTQRQLAERMGYSDALVALVETMKRTPSERFAELADQALRLDGVMVRLQAATTWQQQAPEYLRPWLEEEADAMSLRTWEPLIIPGLLQTESYAREILGTWPGITSEELETRLTSRMRRQAILTKDKPPLTSVVIDEAVIRRRIGDAQVMREQLELVIEMARHPHLTLQVVPSDAGAHCGLSGGFIIAERNGSAYAAYTDSQPVGRTLDDRRTIAQLSARYDAIRAEALPARQSVRLIQEVVNQGE
ncbi:helix-turn-helix transcriptional regulator [Sphaerisporangium sp. B11E5]|uniref:helix-turn-helix domain-containing protein n=1 Tax=Sphaerisporangium sp. B11E5 TaxID=3153563 RepID=UPI00325E9DDF